MKVLLFSYGCHFNICIGLLLEFISLNLEKGNEIYIVKCDSDLEYCSFNPKNINRTCEKGCSNFFDKCIKLVDIPPENIIEFPLKNISFEKLPKSFKNTDELINYTIDGVEIGIGAASTLITEFSDQNFDTLKYKDDVYRALKTSYFVHINAIKIFDEIKPDFVYLFNPRILEVRPILNICKNNNVPFHSYIFTSDYNKYVLFENTYIHDLNYIKNHINELWEKASDNKEDIGKKFFEKQQ
ncbi:MAG: hypothetical protein AB1782_05810, partial [Cyanobacteriota bacterium]